MKKILLIGGKGYIGSFLNLRLREKYDIKIIDLNWFNENSLDNETFDFKDLNHDQIKKYDIVILLAGHSSVKMCENNMLSSFKNNVENFIILLNKLNKNQKFIYASSSSVYGQTNNNIVSEEYNVFVPNNYYDLTKQIIDLYALKSDLDYYSLRFGTVNGWSPNLRVDIMINSMVNSAINDGHIKLYIKDIMRPILGINDLASAIDKIIESDTDQRGIYNLASFNSTSEEIAKTVSNILNIPIKEYNSKDLEKITNIKLQTNAYNFAIDSSKFCKTFDFIFKDTISSITKSIIERYNNCDKTNRNISYKYE